MINYLSYGKAERLYKAFSWFTLPFHQALMLCGPVDHGEYTAHIWRQLARYPVTL